MTASSSVARPDKLTVIVTIAFVVTTLGVFIFDLHSRYHDGIAVSKASTLSYAQILAEHTARTLEGVDHILKEASIIRRDARAGRYSSKQRLNAALRLLQQGSPVLVAIGWTDANGDLEAHSYEDNAPRSNIADMPHFKAQRDSVRDQLFVAPPFRSAATGDWVTAASRRLLNDDGSFAGVLTAVIKQSYFRQIFQAVQLGPNDYVTLATTDGWIIAREPFVDGLIGRSFADGPIYSRDLAAADSGVIESVSRLDGSSRITAFKIVPGRPLVALVSADLRDVLAPWWQHVYTFAPLVTLVVLLVLLGAVVLFRQTHRLSDKTVLLNDVLASMDQGMVVMDNDGAIRVCNPRAIEFLGLPARPFHINDILAHQESTGELEAWSEEARAERDPRKHAGSLNIHERNLRDGRTLEVRTVSLPTGGMVRTFTDITQRKAADRAVRDSETRYRLLADHATDMIFQLDMQFVRRYVSPACQEILGYSPEELTGIKPLTQIHPDDADRVRETYQALALGLDRTSVTNRIRHRDGRWIWVEAELRLVRDEAGCPSGIVGALRNVSARKEMEAEAAAARRQAEEAAAAKGQFLATMSHELRTPLNGILGFADLIQDRNDLPIEVHRQVGLIQTASTALLTVVNDILDFSKLEENKLELAPTAFSLSDLIESVVSIVRPSADKKHLGLRILTDPDAPAYVVGDDARLRQVLLNLLNNAIKFTQTGHIVLAIKCLGAKATSEQLRFSVSDTGIGIPDDKRNHLFQRFSQVDGSISREFGGTGLGLAISKRLVEMMGGQIGVESVFGEGSTFWFTVTLPVADSARAPAAALQVVERRGRSARILLAEDVAMNQEIVRSILETAGHRVDVVGDGAAAIMAVEAQDYDVVLMDVQMPGMDGVSATRHIRALPGPEGRVPIIAMTANVLPEQIASFRAAGMDGHVGKPFRRDELLAAVDRHASPAADPQPANNEVTTAPQVLDAESFAETVALLGQDKMNNFLGVLRTRLQGRLTEVGDIEARRRVAAESHALVSSAGILGFVTLSKSCARLEAACKDDGRELTGLLDEVAQACHAALAEIDVQLAGAQKLSEAV
jgi:PAS domain S-box-containing protein